MGIGSVSNLSADSALPQSADDFNYAVAMDELNKAVDPDVPDDVFAKEHGDVSKAQFVANSFHTLYEWEKAAHNGVAADIADRLVHQLPERTEDRWLTQATRTPHRIANDHEGFQTAEGYADSKARDAHFSELAYLLKPNTLHVIDQWIEAIDYHEHGVLNYGVDALGESQRQKRDEFHSLGLQATLENSNRVTDGYARFRYVEDHINGLSPQAAVVALNNTHDGYRKLMDHVNPGGMQAHWGAEETAKFFASKDSLTAIRSVPDELRSDLAERLSGIYLHMANGDLNRLHVLAQALKPDLDQKPALKSAFDAAFKDGSAQNRGYLALAMTADSIKEKIGTGGLSGGADLTELIQAAGPENFTQVFAAAKPDQRIKVLELLDAEGFAKSWTPEQVKQFVGSAAFKEALAQVPAFYTGLLGHRLAPFVVPLTHSSLGVQGTLDLLGTFDPHVETSFLGGLGYEMDDKPLADRAAFAAAWVKNVPVDGGMFGQSRDSRFSAAASWLQFSVDESETKVMSEAMASGLINGRDALELVQELQKSRENYSLRPSMTNAVQRAIAKNVPLNAEMSNLQAMIGSDAPGVTSRQGKE